MTRRAQSSGLTLIEILLMIAVSGLLLAALSLLLTRIVSISRQQSEQANANQEATDESRRISRAIESARDVTPYPTQWLVGGGPYSIKFYSNVDDDDNTEVVRYFTEDGNTLQRGVTQLDENNEIIPNQSEDITIVARSIRNLTLNQPLFTYNTDHNGTVQSVTLMLAVDVDTRHYPRAITIKTDAIVPRQPLLSLASSKGGRVAGTSTATIPIALCPYSNNSASIISMCTITITNSCIYTIIINTGGGSGGSGGGGSGYVNAGGASSQMPALPGGDTSTAAINFDNKVVVGASSGNIYQLTDSGWATMSGLGSPVTALGTHNDQLYAAAAGVVYVYGNDTWTPLTGEGLPAGASITSLGSYSGYLQAGVNTDTSNGVYFYEPVDGKWENPSGETEKDGDVKGVVTGFDGLNYSAIGSAVYAQQAGGDTVLVSNFSPSQTVQSLIVGVNGFVYALVDDGDGSAVNVYQYNGGTEWILVSTLGDAATAGALFINQGQLCASADGPSGAQIFCDNGTGTWAVSGAAGGSGGSGGGYVPDNGSIFTFSAPCYPPYIPPPSPSSTQTDPPPPSPTEEPDNLPPVANDDEYTAFAGEAFFVPAEGVLDNDFDQDNKFEPITAQLTQDITSGAGDLTLNTDGSFTLAVASDYDGVAIFKYHANDGGAGSNEATVVINIEGGGGGATCVPLPPPGEPQQPGLVYCDTAQ